MAKIKVYVSGPYTYGDTGENMHTHMNTAMKLLDCGYTPIVPVLNHYLHIHSPRSYETWMEYDLELLQMCDVVLRLPGYSPGAEREAEEAIRYEIPTVYSIEELRSYE